jgi:hypothetical protein
MEPILQQNQTDIIEAYIIEKLMVEDIKDVFQ